MTNTYPMERRRAALLSGEPSVCFNVRVDPKLAHGLRILMTMADKPYGEWMAEHFVECLTDKEVFRIEVITEHLEKEVEERLAVGEDG